jgi:peptide/nickel transport system ATP-binding protein/oligopeptide transport system ATP-binding protein
MRLIDSPPGRIFDGEILFENKDLAKVTQEEMRKIRGNKISMIFQEPMTSLNPVFTVGNQISEAILLHKDVSKREAKQQSIEMLKKVGISLPEKRFNEYPHQLSGGMRQRVMIAMALSCSPSLLIADEPTTALDVTIQAQILELMKDMKKLFGMSMMMITHNLGVISEVSDRVAVMYAGEIVESAVTSILFKDPCHPYTWNLIHSIPQIRKDVKSLKTIQGIVPDPIDFPSGCKFHPRCIFADDKCRLKKPTIKEVEPYHIVRCWHIDKLKKRRKEEESN